MFSLIIFGGLAATKYITVKYSFHSKRSRYTWLVNRSAQLRENMAASDAEFSAYAMVIPPFFGALKSRGHAACAKRCFGV